MQFLCVLNLFVTFTSFTQIIMVQIIFDSSH